MKSKQRNILKTILFSSLSAIAGPSANAVGLQMNAITKKETSAENESGSRVSTESTMDILNYSPITGEAFSHSSHGSHGSHSSHSSHTSASHTSHTSHYSSSGYTPSDSYGSRSLSASTKTAIGATLGAAAGGTLLYFVIKAIVKKVKARKAQNYSYKPSKKSYSYRVEYHAYGSRDIKRGDIGADVDEMVRYLIANDLLKQEKTRKNKKYNCYKNTKSVRQSVKRMKKLMGVKPTGVAEKGFLTNLKDWEKKVHYYRTILEADEFDLDTNNIALTALAELLTEKGLLDGYDINEIDSIKQKTRILKAYHSFLKKQGRPETNRVNKEILNLLLSINTQEI